MTAQKNKRLSDSNRSSLYALARKRIAETQDSTELDAAYEKAAQAVHDALIEKYPQKDMRVLARYDAATSDECVYVSRGHYDYDQFCFRADDKRIPLRPSGRGCNSRNAFMLEGDRAEAFSEYKKASEARDNAIKERFALIVRACNSHYDLVEALAAIVAAIEPTLNAAVEAGYPNEENVARIDAAKSALAKARGEQP